MANFICNSRSNVCYKKNSISSNSCNVISFLINYSILIVLIVINNCNYVKGHGMMLEPVGRASRWRYNHSAPADYDDNQSYCGGFNKQWNVNKGECGLCGDDYSLKTPRPHEIGGLYGEGVIVKTYRTGNLIPVGIMLTANHKGYFYFHLCNLDEDKYETESCYKKYPLRLTNDKYKYYVEPFKNGWHNITLKLPKNLICSHCILRWTYNAGNNWGKCPNGSSAVGCGPQENFRSCADVQITSKNDYHYYPEQIPINTDNYNYNTNNINNQYYNNLEGYEGNFMLPNTNTNNNYDNNYINENSLTNDDLNNYNPGDIQNTYYEYNQQQNNYDLVTDTRNINQNDNYYQNQQQQQQQYYNENSNTNEGQLNIPNVPIPILVNNRIDQ